ncbi:MAG: hypothetical protein M1819_005063 [Sarea resinae]|nr:MAG: hypothetical protein M1819_005063 [Sarea resinae]
MASLPGHDWTHFIDRCLLSRIPVEKFESFFVVFYDKHPVTGSQLASLLLRPRTANALSFDPLVFSYAERLLALDRIGVVEILLSLLKTSRLHCSNDSTTSAADGSDNSPKLYNCSELEELLLYRVGKLFTTGQKPKGDREAWAVLNAVSQWMSAMVAASARDEIVQDIDGTAKHLEPETVALSGALGTLVLAVAENMRMVNILSSSPSASPKGIRQAFAHSLALFTPILSQSSLPIANRLETLRKQYGLVDGNSDKALDGNIVVDGLHIQGVDSVLDGPVILSRAGLYILLNTLLVGKPLVEDVTLLHYLHQRYKGDISNLTVDLIIASFDVLSNAMYRNEPVQTMFLLRSFLVNKIPILLTTLSGSMFPPLTAEFCITQALGRIDPNAFPSFSQMFDPLSGGGMLSDVRQEFLFACALHQLIPEESIERLLGEIPMQTLPAGGRYVKEDLVGQCTSSPERVEELLGEIESMDGNAGAIVAAITEVIHNLCLTKETMSLKSICSSLSRRPQSLDIMLLFNTPANLLQPVCQLLDNWRFDEDQGEYQPVYDEFGCIFLLVLAFVHRYGLSSAELGIAAGDSFISRLLEKGSTNQPLEDLQSDQDKHLGGWIRGLFEAEGIGDELMSSCRPQDFYLLVPTLFEQSVTACKANVLDMETLKGGLEYLLETFLLPSLIGALTWLSHRLWEGLGDANILMSILQTLIRPKSISGEAQAMHSTILSIVGRPLEHSLRAFGRLEPSRQEIDPILDALKHHSSFRRTIDSHHNELEQWTSTPGGGLLTSIRNVLQSLVLWSSTAEINMTPPNYTHRQFLAGVNIFGAPAVLRAIIEELKLQAENGSGDLALDIASTLLSATWVTISTQAPSNQGLPDSMAGRATPPSRLSLIDALKLEYNEAEKMFDSDTIRAEIVVRLHRRVEAQVSLSQSSSENMIHNIGLADTGNAQSMDLSGAGGGDIDDVLGAADQDLENLGFMGLDEGGMDLS